LIEARKFPRPRVAFAIIEDPEDSNRRLFLHAKNNLAPPPPGLAFRIDQQILINAAGISSSRVSWDTETVAMTADEAVAASKTKTAAPTLDEAKQLLTSVIGSTGMDVKEIASEAKAAGISWITVRRAKDELGLKAVKAGLTGGWVWRW
jgi:putative DNA primase/helicase